MLEEVVAALARGEALPARPLVVAVLVAARLGPLVWTAPFLGGRAVPAPLRAVLLVALALAATPLADARTPPLALEGALDLGLAVAAEVARGLVYSVAVALPLHALEWAGQAVDLWRGAAAELAAPDTGEPTSPLGLLYRGLAVALFLVLGGHLAALRAFVDGLGRIPLGSFAAPGGGALVEGVARLSADALALAAGVAAPAAVALVVAEVALGVVARAAPQIPAFFAGMPLRAATALAASALALVSLAPALEAAFARALARAASLAFGP